ncbi:MAG: hypothetical protein HY525_17915, partial [Betaproteobacteria bacterium]|nr:hypothetical protein [Betaproteobacteria bacterium]
MNPPHESAQTLLENLGHASSKLAHDVLKSLAAEQRLDSDEIFKSLAASLKQDHELWAKLQQRYYQRHLELWMNLVARAGASHAAGAPPAPAAAPDKSDRRFHAPEWRQLPFFDYLKQAYLLNSRWLAEIVEAARLDAPAKHKLRFFTRQLVDAAAPANYPSTNPEVIKL